MKKHFKKLLITLLAAVGTLCLAAGLVACNDGEDNKGATNGNAVALIAPTVTMEDKTLSWKAVAHATGYIVYENGESVSEQTETTYEITQEYPGNYEYTVKATTTEKGYKESSLSKAVSFKVDPYKLATPVISISDKGVISWQAVEGADGYDIYENGEYVASTSELSYEIEQDYPDVFSYSVVATSTNAVVYSKSDKSEPKDYKVPLHITINLDMPVEISSVTITLYTLAGVKVDEATATYSEGVCKFVTEWGEYLAKVSDGITAEYAATWAHLSTVRRSEIITIVKVEEDNVLTLGQNNLSVTFPAGENYVNKNYIFTAGASEDKYHSIFAAEDATGLQIKAAGVTVVYTDSGIYKGSFATEENEVIIVKISFQRPTVEVENPDEEPELEEITLSYSFEIVNYEIKVPVKVLFEAYNIDHAATMYGDYVNTIYDSCVRYIAAEDVKEDGTYELFVPSTHAHNTFITVTINGKSFQLNGGGIAKVELKAGEQVRIEFVLSSPAEIIFYVYMA